MENIFLETLKVSPMLALFAWLYYKQNNSYKDLVDKIQDQNNKREENYQDTINRNQSIIQDLAEKLNIVDDIKQSVDKIKDKLK